MVLIIFNGAIMKIKKNVIDLSDELDRKRKAILLEIDLVKVKCQQELIFLKNELRKVEEKRCEIV